MNRPRWSWKVWPARRLVQVAVVLVMLALPLVSRYANYLAARQVDKVIEQWDGAVQGELLAGADRALRAGLPDGEGGVPTRRPRKAVLERTALFYGSPWSARLFGLSLTDLLAGAESAFASHRVATVLLVGLAVPFLGTLLLGRVFCSWICPMGLLFELGDKLRRGLRFLEISPLAVRFSRANKYLLLARESHTFVMALFDRAEAGRPGFAVVGLTGATLFLLALVGLEVFVAPRFWCATLCPGGALYSLAGRFRLLRVRRNQATCTHCTLCDVACPMALKPMTDRTGMECDNCGICIDVCPERSLVFRAATTSAGFRPVPPPAPDTSAQASSPSPADAGAGRGGGRSGSPLIAA
ncbi:MAG: 4Fe-4S binding protein, partial [Planctomycetes bacterium]|nr:4Fe-4S binding protein [Planctomycetota bacterium]